MKKALQLIILLSIFQLNLQAQENFEKVDSINFEKAKLKGTEILPFFGMNTIYPVNAAMNNVEGVVAFSFLIDKDGKIDSIKVLKNSNNDLAIAALNSLELSKDLWIPTKINNKPVNKTYLANFKFYNSTTANSYFESRKKGIKLVEKGKYDKALIEINKAIKLNTYCAELYQNRALIYKNTGKMEQAEADLNRYRKYEDKLLIDVMLSTMSIPR